MDKAELENNFAACLDILAQVDKLFHNRPFPSWDDLRFGGGASPQHLRDMADEMDRLTDLRNRIHCLVARHGK